MKGVDRVITLPVSPLSTWEPLACRMRYCNAISWMVSRKAEVMEMMKRKCAFTISRPSAMGFVLTRLVLDTWHRVEGLPCHKGPLCHFLCLGLVCLSISPTAEASLDGAISVHSNCRTLCLSLIPPYLTVARPGFGSFQFQALRNFSRNTKNDRLNMPPLSWSGEWIWGRIVVCP